MDNLILKPSKKRQFGKNTSLTSVESLRTPKDRRKSLGSLLPSPNLNQQSLIKRESTASKKVSKNAKTTKVRRNLVENGTTKSTTHSQSKNHENQFSENVFPEIPKKTSKRRLSVLGKPQSKKQDIDLKSLAIPAPSKEVGNNSDPLVLTSKSLKKKTKSVPKLKLQNEYDFKSNTSIKDLEDQFYIKVEDVKNAVEGVIKFALNNKHLKNQLFNEEIPLFLQINSFKIPKTKGPVKQVFRVQMKHSPLPSDSDICLIVPDVKGIKNNEHEKHLEYYENLLRSKDVTGIKKIMTFHEFRTEYDTFELKNRLADLYDAFLVDGRISGKVVRKCGSIFYKKRKVPIAVKLYLPKLKPHIDQSLKKAFFHLNLHSDSHCVQIGHSKICSENLIENVYCVIEFLNKQFPGKMDNIRSLNVYAHRGSSIPIYISLKNPNEIKVPMLSSKKPKAYKSFSGELTTQYNAEVVVRPSGKVIVKRSKAQAESKRENPDDIITDAEILRETKISDETDQQKGSVPKRSKKDSKKVKEQTDQREPKQKKRKQQTNQLEKLEIANTNVNQNQADNNGKKKNNKGSVSPNVSLKKVTTGKIKKTKVQKKKSKGSMNSVSK